MLYEHNEDTMQCNLHDNQMTPADEISIDVILCNVRARLSPATALQMCKPWRLV